MKSYDSYIRVCGILVSLTLIMLVMEYSRTSMCLCNDRTEEKTQECEVTFVNSRQLQLKPRVIEIDRMDPPKKRFLATSAEMDVLYRIVQAEAGGEDEMGKKMVADVIINRVLDEKFPDTITEVVFQKNHGSVQFSPTKDGRFQSVSVSEETMEAVDEALIEEDYTNGALFFVATSKASKDKVSWFENKLVNKGTHGGHTFYQ